MSRFFKMLLVLLMIIFSIASFSGCAFGAQTDLSATQARKALEQAEEIVLQKDLINFGDHWKVIADGKEVAEIRGEFIKIWDVYTLRSSNGEAIASEEEQLSIITAHAQKLDGEGNEDGYYDQHFTLFFAKIGFFDKHNTKTGSIEQDLALTLDANIKDADGNTAWHMNKTFISAGDQITIKKIDAESAHKMDVVDAVFSAAVLNEIMDTK